ncbi:peroxiredoxin (alkyl hydroperoxide reductase subunit C) [Desulfotomaculum arcticum]|uniref:Peroxiredoxin (Alkyl hydroperoxide reductase subunit C) n=1 Tax=Desulfotruncus arcticus DSM 17038 TaxID=1121424 RepID=A0A1I2U0V1_9FIRM|nr:peroxiredoxin (alkyl hydroperoxide reductase subunit C) [Desulfotomaculum arcticum] [Desulfotruncus arcticus DSM 17038]
MAAVADHYAEFRKLGAEVLGISTDSVYAHKIFAEVSPSARKVQYPLLSDPTHEISECFGAYKPSEGVATRTTLIISPKGLITYFCKYPGSVGRNVNEIIRVLQALQFTEATGLNAPAGWLPGQPGLRKEWDMVGRI